MSSCSRFRLRRPSGFLLQVAKVVVVLSIFTLVLQSFSYKSSHQWAKAGENLIGESRAKETSTLTRASGPDAPPSAVAVQASRQRALHAGCASTGRWRSEEDATEHMIKHAEQYLRYIIYNDDHKLLYCYLPKVACTHWKKILAILNGSLPKVSLDLIPIELAHADAMHPYLFELSDNEIRYRLRHYTAFLFVRHPLERFVSAYRDKFLNMETDKVINEAYAAEIMAQQRPTASGSEAAAVPPSQANITFEEFARWSSNPRSSFLVRNQEHWRPMVDMCYPCLIHYDIIGRLDTLQRDAAFVLRTANITDLTFPHVNPSSTWKHVGPMMSALDPALAKVLLEKYRDDFGVFGYEESWTNLKPKTA